MADQCCCQWGAAVSGEWPEFERPCCPVHGLQFMSTPDDPMCKRHAREAAFNALRAAEEELDKLS